MTFLDLSSSAVTSDVLSARLALTDGLSTLRAQMGDLLRQPSGSRFTNRLSRAIRGDGGVPRTRQRPSPNEAPPRQAHGGNARQITPRPTGTRPGVNEAEPGSLRDSIPTQGGPGGQNGSPGTPSGQGGDPNGGPRAGNGGPPAGNQPGDQGGGQATRTHPARPDPSDAAAEVWALIERAQAGDGAAFGLLYDRYFDTVFRFVYFRVGNRQLAEDLTADTFLRALKRIGSFTWQGRDLGAWLVTIARNLVADHFKSGRYRLEVTTGDVLDADRPDRGPEGSPEAAVIDHITNVDLLRAVKQLNPEQQECIVLRFLHGFSVAETAQAMGKNEGAIKALQYRAVRALARLLPAGFQS